MDPQSASDLGRLDPEAIARVRAEAWPDPANAEELHDALLWLGFLTEAKRRPAPDGRIGWPALAQDARVTRLKGPGDCLMGSRRTARAVSGAVAGSAVGASPSSRRAERQGGHGSPEQALVEIVRGRLEGLGPVTTTALATPLGLEPMRSPVSAWLRSRPRAPYCADALRPGTNDEEWCDRRLLARIHHYTVRRLRAEIEPVAARDFLRFLFAWQHVSEDTRLEGPDALPVALATAGRFRGSGPRVGDGNPAGADRRLRSPWLDDQCLAGRIAWTRLDAAVG